MRLLRFTVFSILLGLLILPLVVTARDEVVEIKIIQGGVQQTVSTSAGTVGDYLAENDLVSTDFKRIFPSLESDLRTGTHIFLYPYRQETTLTKKVAAGQRIISTGALPTGERLVIRGGSPGIEKNGVVIKKPSSRIVLKGRTGFKKQQLKSLKEKGVISLQATGYSPHALDTAPYDDGVSALGLPAGYGLAAVDPRIIPLGTVLYVEGYGYAVAADVGGAIKGRRIDLCFPERSQALIYGRQWTRVHIIG